MRQKVRHVERIIGELARGQQGNVTRQQLLGAGVTPTEIRSRVEKGALLPEFRGVYRVGHRAPSVEALYHAAVAACGDEAALSGLAAAYLHSLIRGTPPPPEVTARHHRRIPGLKTHHCRALDPREITVVRGIRVTTVPRTLVDIAAVLALEDLARACHEAGGRYRTTPRHVEAVLSRRPTAPGSANLRRVLHGDAHVTLGALERRFLELLRAAGLPLPETNRRAGSFRVDCRWPHHRLTVELDSYRWHSSRHAWEQDRRREREARARGDEFRRYTYADVMEDPEPMLRELRALLAA